MAVLYTLIVIAIRLSIAELSLDIILEEMLRTKFTYIQTSLIRINIRTKKKHLLAILALQEDVRRVDGKSVICAIRSPGCDVTLLWGTYHSHISLSRGYRRRSAHTHLAPPYNSPRSNVRDRENIVLPYEGMERWGVGVLGGSRDVGVPTGVPTALIYSCNIFRSSRAAEIYKGGKARAHT